MTSGTPVNLGSVDFWGMAVYDVGQVTSQLTDALGVNFGAPSTVTHLDVEIAGQPTQDVTIETQWSLAGGPFIQVMHADVNFAPWQADADHSSQFAGYAVDDVEALLTQFDSAPMERIAYLPGKFAFYRGVHNSMIQLLQRDLMPTPQSNGSPPEGVFYLGDRFLHFDISPCSQLSQTKNQLQNALGAPFRTVIQPPAPLRFYDINHKYTHTQLYTVLIRPQDVPEPRIDLDQGLPVFGSAVEPFSCGDIHVAYGVESSLQPGSPPGDSNDIDDQMLAAGLHRFCDVLVPPLPGGLRILGFYRGKGGIVIETTDEMFDV